MRPRVRWDQPVPPQTMEDYERTVCHCEYCGAGRNVGPAPRDVPTGKMPLGPPRRPVKD